MRKGDVATVLSYVANRFHSEVELLVWPGNWGYAERTIRGNSTTLSNHASGTAIDLNAPRHPLGKVGTFSSAQKGRIKKILADCGGVVRWGGNYNGRKDEMHFEINAGTAAVAKVAKAIKAGKKPGPSGGATSSGGSSSPTYTTVTGSTPLVKLYHKGEPVKRIQKAVGVKVDGYFGKDTQTAVKAYQKKRGLDADGIVGAKTWAKINGKSSSSSSGSSSSGKVTSKAPAFPLPKGHWYGVESKNKKNHSGYYKSDQAGIKQFQNKLKARGWKITADGKFGPATQKVVRQFQAEKKISVDGAVGQVTWSKIWESPVT
ncbi:peptidoglycan-binding protein [Brevibacterium oceani]|uniref:peptidoglycan-binding protein n=1 Tax=Brevibacterium oceani TaxID=358099 RepID=UPI0015E672F3|nr:peptidoglycan-binding protein [Brevibacterium oceani]